MIAASPLLLELSLSYVPIHRSERWFVRGPNLRYLWICTGDDYGCRIGELPRLEDAVILALAVKTEVWCKILKGVTHVKTLEFDALIQQNLRSLNLLACLDQIPSTC
ncbi:hypothetical protein E2562_037084 [Oryza meyeriana var. granulata]|uniref:Uncharacterized protein n=1 Tax=Oryza meyeriana var. granulata TaxID=110450 RepID=A0A6G1CLD8_9ORYZ|nr:hypothetical protein E2562_037084 [Oryza meyeriana var. granulata]